MELTWMHLTTLHQADAMLTVFCQTPFMCLNLIHFTIQNHFMILQNVENAFSCRSHRC